MLLGVTRSLLGRVTSDGTDDRVFLSLDAVSGTLDVSLGLGGLDLCLTGSVFLLARLCPRGGTSQVADGLDGSTLDGVVLAGNLGWFVGVVGHDEDLSLFVW